MIWAANFGHLPVVEHLVEQGADIHILDNWALISAASNGHDHVVGYLLSKGANIHADNDAPLRYAHRNGHLNTVAYLVSQGANADVLWEEELEEDEPLSDDENDMDF